MSSPEIRLFCSEIDGTLLGNPESAQRFKKTWESLDRGRRPLLVYNTGRSVRDVSSLIAADQLPRADYLIGGIGTEFHETLYIRSTDFHRRFGEGWDPPLVEKIVTATPGVKRPPTESARPHKTKWTWLEATAEEISSLKQRLAEAGLRATVVYTDARNLEVLPANADMGKALTWLCGRVNVPLAQVLVAGACGNNRSVFQLPGVLRILVENASPDLLANIGTLPAYSSRHAMADGVLDGLQHFGVVADAPAVNVAVKPSVE